MFEILYEVCRINNSFIAALERIIPLHFDIKLNSYLHTILPKRKHVATSSPKRHPTDALPSRKQPVSQDTRIRRLLATSQEICKESKEIITQDTC